MRCRPGVRLRGPLALYAAEFELELRRQNYTRLSATDQVRLLAHVSRWLADAGLDAGDLTPERVEQFLEVRRREGRTSRVTVKGLLPLLEFLRRRKAAPLPTPSVPGTAEEELLERYRDHLVRERGLANRTVLQFKQAAGLFMADTQAVSGFDPTALSAADVTRFVARELPGRGVSAAKNTAAGLRSFLRFLHLQGLIARPLAQAVPSVAGWRGASLPRGVPPTQVAQLLSTCDRRRSRGRRDYAILLLLTRLGLRAGEVAGLTLDDIDWHAGEIVVRGKGRHQERLPLPNAVGEAMVGYLQRGRPHSTSRVVFLRAIAPSVALNPGAITWVVYSACDRAGLPRVGAHRLRHTAATQMLRGGASLREVAQVLRHRQPDTTARYAKVDHVALRDLARPWPGGTA